MAPPPFRNKYALLTSIFFFWMLVIDKNDLITQWKLIRMLDRLEGEKTYYHHKIERAERDRENLRTNGERFARERYFMKKKGEDVFIIEEH
ncbi:MAG: hypothetical protein RL386_240 [Bacteroidota bacterium]